MSRQYEIKYCIKCGVQFELPKGIESNKCFDCMYNSLPLDPSLPDAKVIPIKQPKP